MRRLVIAGLILIGIGGGAWAGFDDAVAAYERGDYAAAAREWGMLAKAGDDAAMFNLGHLHHYGLGVPRDPAKAAGWWRRAADFGNAEAQVNLGFLHEQGLGVAADPAAAAGWYRLAAEQGAASAQIRLGLMYEEGHGVARDLVQAYMWFNLAAAQGSEEARHNRHRIVREMLPIEIAKGQMMTDEWTPRTEQDGIAASRPGAAPAE